MTSRTLRLKWTVYLALILVCQTVRLIEGYPRSSSEVSEESPDAGSSSLQDTSISRAIEEAYEQQVFLRPQEWPQKTIDEDNNCCSQRIEQMQRDTSKEKFSSDRVIQRSKKSLQDSNTDMSMYRSSDISHRNTGTSMHRNSDEKIIFPDGRILTSETPMLPTLSCRKNTFCENVADYPRQLVNAAIQRNVSLRFLESVDTVDSMPDVDDVEQRIDTMSRESVLCPIREQVVYPQTAQNKENQWLFIVNQDDLKQGIRIEVCLNEGQKCNMVEGFAEGYKTSCKQKYIYRELAAVGSDGNIFKDQFRFPSSCCCHVKFTGDPTARLGLRLNLPVNQTQ
ncbi:Protein spaetzle [Atta colombica]|uniref:Protein spaetzle n=1 Tax=Atta colombica TaxID=520822 RepID=A0A195B526_9HYME|nr:PREDICTED: protein spaetzle-like [Atta colombica]KYM79380.1 Protein spaetzle [Atta colombica]